MEKNYEIDNIMFEIITEVSMGILLDIINHIEIYSHDFEDFISEQYKNSEVRELLKEEYLRLVLYEKLKSKILDIFIPSKTGQHITRWFKIIPEKEYDNNPKKNCDLYLRGQVLRKRNTTYAYKRDFKKNAWIEIKFITPINDASADTSTAFMKDLLRLLFLADDFTITERYLVVFILCGQYKNKKKEIRNYFLKNEVFQKLFYPTEFDVPEHMVINIEDFVAQCNNRSKNFSNNIKEFEEDIKKIDLIYLNRRIISPFKTFNEKPIEKYDKSLFGYIFHLEGYRIKK